MHQLPHTWDALLARFGRLTEIQARAIGPLLAGKNCALVSATASGKTEAALAPLLERYKQISGSELRSHTHGSKNPASSDRTARPALSLVYIVPTRALTRDLARRLEKPLARLAIRMGIKTGDEPALDKSRPPELLLTTPESFDSLLANAPRLAKDVRAVILDEIHLYDNTARGDQLRILLNRLRRIKSYALARGDTPTAAVQFCALSATINDPAGVAARYFADPLVVQTGGQRALDAELLELTGIDSLRMLFAGLRREKARKVLVFCRRRAECEELAHLFYQASPFGDHVFVHHASLDARVRHAAERNFSVSEAALCFATSTLELGIDIGDVDLIVLMGPPDNTSSFLQRIGRGNRRTLRTAVVCFYRTETERALFQVFIRAAKSGEIESNPYFFRPSVVIQQLCSYIKQTRFGEIETGSAYELFTSPEGAPLIGKPQYDRIVEHLIHKDYFVVARGSALRPGPKWQELYEQRALYTNLTDSKRGAVDVIDEMTGRRLGEIQWGIAAGEPFLLGGRTRRATWTRGRKLIVRTTADESAARAPRFRTPWLPLTRELARALAKELGVPRPDPASAIPMILEQPPAQADTAPSLPAYQPRTWLFHCAGGAYGLVLGDLLGARYRLKVEDCNELYVTFDGMLPTITLEFTVEQVRAQVERRWRQFEGWSDMGRFQSQLPPDARRASTVEAFNIAEFLRTFSGCRIMDTTVEGNVSGA